MDAPLVRRASVTCMEMNNVAIFKNFIETGVGESTVVKNFFLLKGEIFGNMCEGKGS